MYSRQITFYKYEFRKTATVTQVLRALNSSHCSQIRRDLVSRRIIVGGCEDPSIFCFERKAHSKIDVSKRSRTKKLNFRSMTVRISRVTGNKSTQKSMISFSWNSGIYSSKIYQFVSVFILYHEIPKFYVYWC